MSDHASPAVSGTVGADVVCDFIVDWGSPYARDNKNPFCGKPAAWKWTHAVIKSRGVPDIFDKIVTDYYCQAHGERMQGQGGFEDVGKWKHIADNAAGEGAAKPYPPPAGSVACPSCGGRLHRTVEQGMGWQGECTACHMRGPWRETEAAALEAWLSFADPVDTQNAPREGRAVARTLDAVVGHSES